MAIARRQNKKRLRVRELKQLISARFPDARFVVGPAPDARGVTAIWTYSSADPEEIANLVAEKEFEFKVNDDVHLIVIPMPPEDYRH
jgi:hypothetical protein